MQSNKSESVWRRTAFSGRSVLTALAIAAMVVVLPGCPGTVTDPCSVADVCDDSDLCTTDTCTSEADTSGVLQAVCTNTAVTCPDAGDVCNPADGVCVECVADTDCADALWCNGDETCVDNACVAGTDECTGANEVCNDTTDACDTTCTDDADCADDGNFCTGDATCTGGVCGFAGDPCVGTSGTPVCDETNNACVECLADTDCTGDDTCVANVCTPPAPDCNSNGDCDDGLFCNGVETCDTTGFTCAAGTAPCDPDTETCDDDTDTCNIQQGEFTDPVALTTSIDFLNGDANENTFVGTHVGASITSSTINLGDQIDGKGGAFDRFNVIATDDGTTPAIDAIFVDGVEEFYIRTGTGSISWDLSAVTGATELTFNNGSENLTLNNVPNLVDLRIVQGTNNDVFQVNFDDDIVDGSSDTLTVYVDKADIAELDVQGATTAAEGFETVTFVTGGGGASEVSRLRNGDDAQMTTVNIQGSDNLKLGDGSPLANATTIDGSTATGNLELFPDTTEVVTVTTGSGDDIVDFAGGLTTTDAVDLGDGNDRVAFTGAATVENLDLTGVEDYEVAGGATIDFNNVTPGRVFVTGNNNTVVNNLAKGTPLTLFGTLGNTTINVDGAGDIGSSSDVVDITLGFDDSGTSTAATVGASDIIVDNVETLNLITAEGAADAGDIDADACTAVNISGDQDIQVDFAATSAVLSTVNASGLTDSATADIDTTLVTNPVTITGSDNADTIDCEDVAGATNVVVGAGGADVIDLDAGATNAGVVQQVGYTSADDGGSAVGDNLANGDTVANFTIAEDQVIISGSLRSSLVSETEVDNTGGASTTADLNAGGIFLFSVAGNALDTIGEARTLATVTTVISSLTNESVGDVAIFMLEDGGTDFSAVYVFTSVTSDGAITEDEIQLLGFITHVAAAAITTADIAVG